MDRVYESVTTVTEMATTAATTITMGIMATSVTETDTATIRTAITTTAMATTVTPIQVTGTTHLDFIPLRIEATQLDVIAIGNQ